MTPNAAQETLEADVLESEFDPLNDGGAIIEAVASEISIGQYQKN